MYPLPAEFLRFILRSRGQRGSSMKWGGWGVGVLFAPEVATKLCNRKRKIASILGTLRNTVFMSTFEGSMKMEEWRRRTYFKR